MQLPRCTPLDASPRCPAGRRVIRARHVMMLISAAIVAGFATIAAPAGAATAAGTAQRAAAASGRASSATVSSSDLLGMNDGGVDFVNVMDEPYPDPPAPATGPGTLTTDASGWPTEDVTYTIFDDRQNMPWDGPNPTGVNPNISGTYHLAFNGQATINGNGEARVGYQRYDAATNTTTADIVVAPNQWLVQLTFTNTKRTAASDPDSGLTNIKLIRPGYPLDTTQVFTNATVNAYRATSGPIRTLGLDATNSYQNFSGTSLMNVSWADRVKVSDAYQGGTPAENSNAAPGHQGHGLAWEYIVMLANEANRGLWINIPAGATDNYITNLADLIRYGSDGLEPYTSPQAHPVYAGLRQGLPVYVEYSDEVWNFSFPQYTWNVTAAQQQVAAGGSPLNNDGTTNGQILGARRYAQRSYQISNLFKAVYGQAEMNTVVRPVFLWQYQASYYEPGWLGWGSGTADVLDWFSAAYGPPDRYFYGLGSAMYYGPGDTSSVDNIFNTMWTGSDQTRAQVINWRALATYYRLAEVGYESGPSLGAGLGGLATNDPRMSPSEMHEYLDNWYAAGGNTIEFFALRGNVGSYGDWLAVTDFHDLSTPKMTGLQNVEAASVPAVDAGYVLPASIGQTATIDPSQYAAPDGVAPGTDLSIPGSGYTSGPYDYLLRVGASGTYSFTLAGSQNSADLHEQVSIDGSPLATVSLPASPGSAPAVRAHLGAGLHTLRIQYAYSNGASTGDARPSAITVTLASGGGAAMTPSAPGSPTVSSVSTGTVNLTWPTTTLAQTYTVRRSEHSGGPYSPVARVTANTYSDTGLTDGTTYYYVVQANDQAGSSGTSPQVAAAPTSPGAPPAPTGLATTFSQNGVIHLQWAGSEDATGYDLYRSTGAGSYTLVTSQLADHYADTGLTDGTVYSYQVSATNSFGQSARSAPLTVTPTDQLPAPPTDLHAVASDGQVALRWTPPPGMSPEFTPTQYTVYRSSRPGGPYQAIISTSVANALDVTATNGTSYSYVVTANNAVGDSAYSTSVTATPSAQGAVSINAGGQEAGPFAADADWSGGRVVSLPPVDTSATDLALPQAVWRTAREGTFSYTLRGLVPHAPYNLRLLFAAPSGSPQAFGVSINGTPALIDLDVAAETGGPDRALAENIQTSADAKGVVTLQFSPSPGSGGAAEVNGVQIYGAGAPGAQ